VKSAHTILFAKLEERGQLRDAVVDEWIILQDNKRNKIESKILLHLQSLKNESAPKKLINFQQYLIYKRN
jgi:hypothetical protein